jgi:dTDP-4-dehydrorhamnose 3,5-epimerase
MQFKKAKPVIKPNGEELVELFEGVKVKDCITHLDNRGSLTELFNTNWDFDSEPIVHVYKVAIAPGVVKGWQYHTTYADRSFFGWGKFRIALHDLREDSKTYKQTITIYAGIERPRLIRIPTMILHAVQNLSQTESWFINMPTKSYNYLSPDKYRIPWDSPEIPYDWRREALYPEINNE